MHPVILKLGLYSMFFSGFGVLLAVLLSWWWHKLDAKTEQVWDKKRRLNELNAHLNGSGPGDDHTREEWEDERERLEDEVAVLQRLGRLADWVRGAGLVMLYTSAVVGAVALIIRGYRAFE